MKVRNIVLSIVTISSLNAISLKECVEDVINTNPIVKERLYKYRSDVQDLNLAKSEKYPSLDLTSSIGRERTDDDNWKIAKDTKLTYYENSLVFLYNIFNGYSTTNKITYQQHRVVAASYNFIEKANDVAFKMTQSYIELLKNKELLTIAKDHITVVQSYLQKVKYLVDAGLEKESQLKKVQVALALANSNLIAQKNNTLDALANFAHILGRNISLQKISEPYFDIKLPQDINIAIKYAIKNNPSLLVSEYNIKSAMALRKQKTSGNYPTIDFRAEQNFDNNVYGVEQEKNRLRVGLVLKYNFFSGGKQDYTKQKYISQINREVQLKEQLKRDVIAGMELSWNANIMLKEQLKTLKEYKVYTADVKKLYEKEYDSGSKTMLDVLSAEDSFKSAKIQYIKSYYEYMFTRYRILDSMGLLIASFTDNSYDYLTKVGLTKNELDKELIIYDQDNDKIVDDEDICPNSILTNNITGGGCKQLKNLQTNIIHFDPILYSNDSNITTNGQNILEDIEETLKNSKDYVQKVIVSGNWIQTNNRVQDYNKSYKIANEVKTNLAKIISDDKLIVKANGGQTPLSNDDKLNKRVEVILFLNKKK